MTPTAAVRTVTGAVTPLVAVGAVPPWAAPALASSAVAEKAEEKKMLLFVGVSGASLMDPDAGVTPPASVALSTGMVLTVAPAPETELVIPLETISIAVATLAVASPTIATAGIFVNAFVVGGRDEGIDEAEAEAEDTDTGARADADAEASMLARDGMGGSL